MIKIRSATFLVFTILVFVLSSCNSKNSSNQPFLDEFEKLSDKELIAIINSSEENSLQGKIRVTNVEKAKAAKKALDFRSAHKIENENNILIKEILKKNIQAKNPQITDYNEKIIENKVLINGFQYDAYYYETGPKFRVICEQPCKISKEILKLKLKGSRQAIEELLNFTKSSVPSQFEPVDIHLIGDSECGDYDQILKEKGYVSNFYGTRDGGGSFMCLWEFNNPNILLPPGIKNSQKIQSQNQVVHEYTHAILNKKVVAYMEDFAKAFSYHIAGIWTGGGMNPSKEDKDFPKLESACDENLNDKYQGKIIYDLCKKCNMEMDKIPDIIKEIDNIYYSGQGETKYDKIPSKLSIPQLKKAADKATGLDTEKDCGIDWSEA